MPLPPRYDRTIWGAAVLWYSCSIRKTSRSKTKRSSLRSAPAFLFNKSSINFVNTAKMDMSDLSQEVFVLVEVAFPPSLVTQVHGRYIEVVSQHTSRSVMTPKTTSPPRLGRQFVRRRTCKRSSATLYVTTSRN
jgi:hypothetical protein